MGDIGRGVWLPGEALDSEQQCRTWWWAARRAPSFIDTGLTNGTTYHYVGLRRPTGGTRRGRCQRQLESGQCHATSTPAPAAHRCGRGQGNAQVSLSWTASSGATSYNVKRSTVSGGPGVHHGGQHRRDKLTNTK